MIFWHANCQTELTSLNSILIKTHLDTHSCKYDFSDDINHISSAHCSEVEKYGHGHVTNFGNYYKD